MKTNLRKAAILLSCLDTDTADRLLDALGEDEARRVRDQLVNLVDVSPAERQAVIDEFMRIGPIGGGPAPVDDASDATYTTTTPALGGFALETPADTDYTPIGDDDPPRAVRPWADVLHDSGQGRVEAPKTMPPTEPFTDTTLDDPANVGPALGDSALVDDSPVEPFRFLCGTDNEHLPALLDGEHPQTIALVLSHLTADRALGVLRGLSPATQADVIRRLVDLGEADPETLREVERGLESRMSQQSRRRDRRSVGLSLVSGILQAADADEEEEILGNLASYQPTLAATLDHRFASVDQLTQLPDHLLAAIIATLDTQVVVLALLGSSSQLAERVLAALPRSLARNIRGAMTCIGPVRLDDVEHAKDELVAAARRQCRSRARPLSQMSTGHLGDSQHHFSHAV
jgi:flagellar motor switch protein FliG